jgi:hypothetical protein
MQCERCLARYSVCPNSGAETSTPPGPECSGGKCIWRPSHLLVAKGSKPWVADMPGAYGPGDVFQSDGERVFVGGKSKPGEWITAPPGTWKVGEDGRLSREVADAQV